MNSKSLSVSSKQLWTKVQISVLNCHKNYSVIHRFSAYTSCLHWEFLWERSALLQKETCPDTRCVPVYNTSLLPKHF